MSVVPSLSTPPLSSSSSSSSSSLSSSSSRRKSNQHPKRKSGAGEQGEQIVRLNIGGKRFETRMVTLCQRSSMLSVMFGGTFATPSADYGGEVFFVGDHINFKYLIN